jgi:zinc/manganese transport system substrate-binding protein
MNPFRLSFILLFVLGILAHKACNADPIKIISLNSVITEIVSDVGGDKISVISLIKPDVDPHSFEPTAANLRSAASANLIIASGLGVESYLSKIKENTNYRVELICIGDKLNSSSVDSKKQNLDPHWWQSIDSVIDATNIIADALSRLSPLNSTYFQSQAQLKILKLKELKVWSVNEVSKLPENKRDLVTSHDAFSRFARDFKFRVHPITGLSPEAEPNAKDIASLIDLIRSANIKSVFIENRISPKITEGIIHDTGAQLGGTLYADGLGSKEFSTYESMYRHNVITIVEGLK